jgi:hypothetical protein
MEIRIDIDEELLKAAGDQERREFMAALFFAASRATSAYGAVVDFEDSHHWVITVPDRFEPLTRQLLAGQPPDPAVEDRLFFERHLDEASAVVATWPEWKRSVLSSGGAGS